MEITKEKLELATTKANHEQLRVMYDAVKAERDALAAQVEALRQSVTSVRARGNLLHNITLQILQGVELNGSDWDYISESQVAEIEHHLAELRAEAGRDGFLEGVRQMMDNEIGWFGHDADSCANHYANRVRLDSK